MKKFLVILHSLISVICLIFTVGCYRSSWEYPLTEGTYETIQKIERYDSQIGKNIEHEQIKTIKLVLKQIDKNEFDKANVSNVVEDRYQKNNDKKFFSFALYFFIKDVDDFVQVIVSNLVYENGTPDYSGQIFCETESYRLESSFFFDYSETDTKIGCNIKWTEEKDLSFWGAYLELKK